MHLDCGVHLVNDALDKAQGKRFHEQELHAIDRQLCALRYGLQGNGPALRRQPAWHVELGLRIHDSGSVILPSNDSLHGNGPALRRQPARHVESGVGINNLGRAILPSDGNLRDSCGLDFTIDSQATCGLLLLTLWQGCMPMPELPDEASTSINEPWQMMQRTSQYQAPLAPNCSGTRLAMRQVMPPVPVHGQG